ncbi:MAG: class I SAM-dependent methyltransferase [Balneolaceae bacterium]|nr:class I SAM-dependent methyltransferase [Balneolaceae bacterium]
MSKSRDEVYKEKWDHRYSETNYAYGKAPNLFFKEWLLHYEPGSILMPADGEGRNGVFAAEMGWDVTCFDLSEKGKRKALQLAGERGVTLKYDVGDLEELSYEQGAFDVIALIYAHFSAEKKSWYHERLSQFLKPGGIFILEAFSKKHLNYVKANPDVGGAMDFDMLYSKDEIRVDFENYKPLLLTEQEVDLNEGKYHLGQSSVIRFVGKKEIPNHIQLRSSTTLNNPR